MRGRLFAGPLFEEKPELPVREPRRQCFAPHIQHQLRIPLSNFVGSFCPDGLPPVVPEKSYCLSDEVRDVGAALRLVRAGRPMLLLRGGVVLGGRAHAAGTAMRRAPAVSGGRRRRDVGAALRLVRAGRPMLLLRGGVVLGGRPHAAGTAMRRAPAVSGGRRRRDVGAALRLVRAGRPMLLLRGGVVLGGRPHAAGTALRRPPAVSGGWRRRDVGAALRLVRAGRPMLLLRGGVVLGGRPHAAGTAMRRAHVVSGGRRRRCHLGRCGHRWWRGGSGPSLADCQQGIASEVRERLAALAARFYGAVLSVGHIGEDAVHPPLGLRQGWSPGCFTHRISVAV